MKILILGSSGMAGSMINSYLQSLGKYDIRVIPGRSLLDASNKEDLKAYISYYHIDTVINCVGLINVYANKPENIIKTIEINSLLPHYLSTIANMVIHISTDCIYSGDLFGDIRDGQVQCYDKLNHDYDAKDIYGKTKFLGELNNGKDLTLRQSIIGPEIKCGYGLLHWFLSLPKDSKIDGYINHIWNGITTLQLAKDIDYHLSLGTTGIFNGSNTWYTTKYDLLRMCADVFGRKDITINLKETKTKNMSIASDRRNNVLDYKEMLVELKSWMDSHKDIYKQYYD